jgi:glycosyltransferase involved in cell wall biosynthesis
MDHKSTISIATATYNESSNINRFLKSLVDWVDEIVICDGESSDDTAKLASKYSKVKIISTTNKPNFHINKQIAIDACKCNWILQLDADEIVTPELKKEIISILSQPSVKENGFWIKRKNFFLGQFLKKGGAYPDPTLRLYKNGKGKLPCKSVHEQAQVDGNVGFLKNDLAHYSDPSFTRYLMRNNRYTSVIAKELEQQHVSLGPISFINFYFIKPIFRFLQIYLRHRGYVDGFPGFVYAFYSALVYPAAYTKYWETIKTNQEQYFL